MGFAMHLFCVFVLFVIAQNCDGTANNSVIEDLRKPAAPIPTEIPTVSSTILVKEDNDTPRPTEIPTLSSTILVKEDNETPTATNSEIVSRVKRQYYDDGYYNRRYRYYPYPLPIFIGGGGLFGPGYGRGFGGRGFGGRGFGGGRGIGGRGVGGIGGHGVGGGHGGGGGGGRG